MNIKDFKSGYSSNEGTPFHFYALDLFNELSVLFGPGFSIQSQVVKYKPLQQKFSTPSAPIYEIKSQKMKDYVSQLLSDDFKQFSTGSYKTINEEIQEIAKNQEQEASHRTNQVLKPICWDLSYFFNNYERNFNYLCLSSMDQIFQIPLLLRYKQFQGTKFLCTQALFDIGFLIMKDFYQFIRKYNQEVQRENGAYTSHFLSPGDIRKTMNDKIPSQQEIENSKEFFECLQFGQLKALNSYLTIKPLSSGHHLGSCHWILTNYSVDPFEKYCVMSGPTSLRKYRYPQSMNLKEIANSDLLLVLATSRDKQIPNLDTQLQNLLDNLIKPHLARAFWSKILIPCASPLLFFDLIDIFRLHISENVKIKIYGQSAPEILHYGQIAVNWLNQALHVNIQKKADPILLSQMTKRMKVYRSLEEEFKSQNKQSVFDLRSEIIIAAHSSLILGESRDILDSMKASKIKDSQAPNLVIHCDPYLYNENMLKQMSSTSSYQQNNAKIEFARCPLDPTISEQQLAFIINEVKPRTLIVSDVNYKVIKNLIDNYNLVSNFMVLKDELTLGEIQDNIKTSGLVEEEKEGKILKIDQSEEEIQGVNRKMSQEKAQLVINNFISRLQKIQLFQFDVRKEGKKTIIQAKGSKFKGRVQVSQEGLQIYDSEDTFQKEMIVQLFEKCVGMIS